MPIYRHLEDRGRAVKIDPAKVISPSGLTSYSDCRLQWYWSRPMGYRTRRRDSAFDLGIGVHIALADYYEHHLDPVASFTKWAEKQIRSIPDGPFHDEDMKTLFDVRTMGIVMLEGYLKHYANEDLEVVAVERSTAARPIPGYDDWFVQTRVDMLVRIPARGNTLWVMEHKTFSQMYLQSMELDHQFVAEAWTAEGHFGEAVEGVLYNGLRKQAPSPKVRNPLFERHYITVGDQQVRHFLRRCKGMIKEISQQKLSVYPEPGTIKCSRCAFTGPCNEYVRGGDYKYMLDTMFDKSARP